MTKVSLTGLHLLVSMGSVINTHPAPCSTGEKDRRLPLDDDGSHVRIDEPSKTLKNYNSLVFSDDQKQSCWFTNESLNHDTQCQAWAYVFDENPHFQVVMIGF